MKCLIINGSPRKGFTWKAVQRVKEQMLAMGEVEFEELMLAEADIPMCKGCFICFNQGEDKCPHASRVQPIVQKIQQADALIITSPVYSLNVSGLIKNFFDHTSYLYHRPRMFDKKALVITSTAGGAAAKTASYMRDTLKHWGFNRVYTIALTVMGNTQLTPKMQAKCDATAKTFFKDVESKKIYPPTWKRVMFYNMWRSLCQLPSGLPADKEYWSQSQLKNSQYGPQVPIGPAKRLFGKMLGGMFGKMVQ